MLHLEEFNKLISKQDFKNKAAKSILVPSCPLSLPKTTGGNYGRIRKGTKYAGIAFNKVVAVLQTLEEKVHLLFGSCLDVPLEVRIRG